MAKTLQFRRGTTTELNAITGAVGELFVDTTKDTVVVMDGTTAGGSPLATEAALTSGLAAKASTSALTSGLANKQNTLVSGSSIKTINNQSLLGSGNITISGGSGGSADLTQVSTDITPLFDDVYDIGSTTNRFYDAYLSNKLDINGTALVGSKVTIPGSTVTSTSIAASYSVPNLEPMAASMVSTNASNFAIMISIPYGQSGVAPYSTLIAVIQALTNNNKINITWTSNAGPGYTNITRTLSNLTVTGWTTEVAYTTSYIIYVQEDLVAINHSYALAHPDVMESQLRVMLSNQPMQLDKVVTTSTALPDTYDYTLASNASLVVPEIIADVALLGTNLVEADTITPEHILGAYTDQRGTLIVDGSVKVNDDLRVRNSITLQQEPVDIGAITAKRTIPSSVNRTTVQPQNLLSTFGVENFYFGNDEFWVTNASQQLALSMTANGFVMGNTVTFRNNPTGGGFTWTFLINSVSLVMNELHFYYSVVSTDAPWSQPSYWLGYGSSMGYTMSSTTAAITTSITTPIRYVLELDKAVIQFTSSNSLLINGASQSAPVASVKTVNTAFGSTGWYNVNNVDPSGYYKFDWNNNLLTGSPGVFITDTISIFSNGNTVTIKAYGYGQGDYLVSNADYGYSMYYGNNGSWQFKLTYVGNGSDVVGMYGFSTCMSGPSGTINISASVTTIINYSSAYMPQLVSSSIDTNTYISLSEFTWTNVGDKLSYIPSSTSISFKKNDGTSVKAITYNNATGSISYDGIVIPPSAITIDSNNTISSNNVQTKTAQQSITLGLNAVSEGGATNSVVLGTGAKAYSSAYQAISIGTNAWSSSGVSNSIAIGVNAGAVGGYGDSNIAFGNYSQVNASNSSIAIGLSSSISSYSGNATAIGSYANSGGSDSISIGTNSYSSLTNNIALGKGVQASGVNSFFRMGNGNTNQSSPTVEVHRWASSFDINNQTKYVGIGNVSDSALNYIYFPNTAWYEKSTIYGTAMVIIRGTTENTTQWKIVEVKFVAYSTSAYQSTISQISATTIASGGNTTWNSAITAGVVTGNTQYIDFKIVNSTTTNYTIGADIKATLYCFSI
jgi:hypothetical protein